ncbi:hypothetical protein [Clostridium uliginosum]|uniref:Uncharacterized protein n=1 Tax=Clostridium uliginosum TaxID=119641 RepID=A0A1I1J388_9CLOT|nr:hypothetical protein [Clostridium uliginosum]SFC40403.1 hypothetical protein SAMN05421842_10395 [Clostridium uliginosum]
MLILITYIIITAILAIVFVDPVTMTSSIPNVSPSIAALIVVGISLISFILGIIARFQKESKKVLPTIAIVISGLFLIPAIMGLIESTFHA